MKLERAGEGQRMFLNSKNDPEWQTTQLFQGNVYFVWHAPTTVGQVSPQNTLQLP